MIRISSILLIAGLSFSLFAADFSEVLTKVTSYDYGDSRENLTVLSDMLRQESENAVKLAEYEEAMLQVVGAKETTFAAKQFLCKELSIMGTEQSVPILAKLLKQEETADIARYALERIPGEQVDATLLAAMKKTQGAVQIGIINTIGERRMAGAAADLGKLLAAKDADVAMAAAAALGKIGTDESATLLGASLLKAKGNVRVVAVDAYLKNADAFFKNGAKEKAEAIYEPLFAETESIPTRAAALTGLIKTVENPTELIVDVLSKDENSAIKAVAISMVHQCKRDMDLPAIAALLPNLDPLGHIQLLTAFKVKGDPVVRDAVIKALQDEDEDVSIAAIQALSAIGAKEDVELLAQLAGSTAGDKQKAAKEALARLNADGINDAIIAATAEAAPQTKVELIEAVGARQMTASVPTLLAAAKDKEVRVRVATLKSLAQVAAPTDLPALIELLVNAQVDAERREAERTVVTIASQIEEKEKQGDAVIDAMAQVKDMKAKSSLMLVAGRLGDADGLTLMREALSSKEDDLKRAAILSLSEWPTPTPLDDLENVAKTAKESAHRVLGLRGYIRLLGLESDRPKAETVAKYKNALDMAEQISEKRLALSGLAEVQSSDAMFLAAEYLDDPDLKGEAEIAVLGNAWRARGGDVEKRKAIIRQVYENTTDDRIKSGAKELLDSLNQ
ncbi:HEAT repeat domain-containing protein [candidate division KSB1 bacterium]|nr:HEAT repeat domain-containing protein [candidate division KSB1 bacterium]